ncbi:MAG: class 1 fructose-bisphosphatase [Myxococcota bacterium]
MAHDRQFEEGTTLDRFLMDTLADRPSATGTFVNLCQSIGLAGKMISAQVNRAGLAGMFGSTGDVNVQGEFVQKLDAYANTTFANALLHRGHTCMVVSEEEDDPVYVDERYHSGRYVVTVDPLDGSSNIDCNATIGTVFGIFRRITDEGGPAELRDVLRPGRELVGAGYVIYGSGTVLVLGTDAGVHGFTLDPTVGEFFLSHPNIRYPTGKTYSCNEAYSERWAPGVRTWLRRAKERGFKARYIGSLVADVHRNLLKGGIFFYPADTGAPQGKLRLLYEGSPLAWLIERAGGAATDGKMRIVDKTPSELHERTPLVLGDAALVAELTELMVADPLSVE